MTTYSLYDSEDEKLLKKFLFYSKEEIMKYLKENPDLLAFKIVKIKYVQNQDAWVPDFRANLHYLEQQIQFKILRENAFTIRYIKNPTEEILLETVRQDGNAIQFIKNPSEQVQLEAVRQTGFAIEFINNPSEQVQIEALKQDGRSFVFIDDPCEQAKLEAKKQGITL